MSHMTLPKIFLPAGARDIVGIHPSVAKILLLVVVPMSLIPPLMYAYAQVFHPGEITSLVKPPLTVGELTLVGGAFFLIELATVALMAFYIRELAGSAGVRPDYADAYTLAAFAPVPLWFAALGLFVPSLWFNVMFVAAAWIGSAAIIRYAVGPLFDLDDDDKARRLANAVILTGVATWVGLMLVLVMLLGIFFTNR